MRSTHGSAEMTDGTLLQLRDLTEDFTTAEGRVTAVSADTLAVQHLKARGGKVGVTGFCMGGALTILSLTMSPEADAGVVWYGFPPLEFVDASKIRVPVMAHWAEQDVPFPIATVEQLEEKLRAAGVAYTGHRYLAQHGFANETAQGPGRIPITQYDATWARMAMDRTLAFFGRHLA